jgi:hypothetical protein
VRGCGGVLGCGGVPGRGRGRRLGSGGAGLWRLRRDYGEGSERLRIKKKKENTRSERTVKRVRSAFRAMTGRGGRMTRRDGGSVRSQSSKLLE